MSGTGDTRSGGLPVWARVALGLAAVLALFVLYSHLPVGEWIAAFRDWTAAQGAVGWIVFALVYAVAVTALVPGSFLTLAAGVAYGLWGFPIVLAGATIGAGMSFLAGRYLVRQRVQSTIAGSPKLRAVDAAIAEEDWKIVGLLRLSPVVPFSLQNWVLGATGAGFGGYMLATFFGIMPGTLLYVWIGTLGADAAGGDEASLLKYVFFGIGIAATLIVTILVGRKASAKLKEHGLESAGDEAP